MTAKASAFLEGLRRQGWIDGRYMQIYTRWGTNDTGRRRYAAELVAQSPDIILASITLAMMALQQTTSSVPIVSRQAPPSQPGEAAQCLLWHRHRSGRQPHVHKAGRPWQRRRPGPRVCLGCQP